MRSNTMARAKAVADSAINIAVGIAAVLLICRTAIAPTSAGPRRGGPPVVEEIASQGWSAFIGDAPHIGQDEAPVVLMEYSDFQCPYCARHAATAFDQIRKDYVDTGRVKYVFLDFPISDLHPAAIQSALAGRCSDQQGQFVTMRKYLFEHQKELGQLKWRELATELGMDADKFDQCLASADRASIESEKREAGKFGVDSTPTFLIGKRGPGGRVQLLSKLQGAAPYATFKGALDDALD
jgi:protein-disulfide isomerase